MVCKSRIKRAASTIGSIAAWGAAPCPPRPRRVMSTQVDGCVFGLPQPVLSMFWRRSPVGRPAQPLQRHVQPAEVEAMPEFVDTGIATAVGSQCVEILKCQLGLLFFAPVAG